MMFEGWKVTDIHVHIQPLEMVRPEAVQMLRLGKRDFDFVLELIHNPSKFVEHLDREGVWRAALINYVSEEVIGFTEEVNAFVSEYSKEYPDRLLSFGGVDPRRDDVEEKMEDLISKHEVRALKIHPPHQLLYPNGYLTGGPKGLETVYSMAEDAGLPVMVHTGTSIFPRARVRYGNPLALDDVAIDFPRLNIIMAHGGRPFWTDEAFFLLRRHENMYFDISSIPPKRLLDYFPRLEDISQRTLFGSDWPGPMVPGMRSNIDDFLSLPIAKKAKRMILEGNALKLFR